MQCWRKAAKCMDVGSFQSWLPHFSSVPGTTDRGVTNACSSGSSGELWTLNGHRVGYEKQAPWGNGYWPSLQGGWGESRPGVPVSGAHEAHERVLWLKGQLTELNRSPDNTERENVYSLRVSSTLSKWQPKCCFCLWLEWRKENPSSLHTGALCGACHRRTRTESSSRGLRAKQVSPDVTTQKAQGLRQNREVGRTFLKSTTQNYKYSFSCRC